MQIVLSMAYFTFVLILGSVHFPWSIVDKMLCLLEGNALDRSRIIASCQ